MITSQHPARLRVIPDRRLATPLGEEAVQQLVARFKQSSILEHFHAANRKCLSPQQLEQHAAQVQHLREQRAGSGAASEGR